MFKQFLLNSDGSIPGDIDLKMLEAMGIPLVMPTQMPCENDMIAVEQAPLQDDNGIWRQVWILEPIPKYESVDQL